MRWGLCTLLVLGICAAAASAGSGHASPVDIRAAYPGVQFASDESGLARIYGTTFGWGQSPEAVAADFVGQFAEALGVSVDELTPANQFNRQYTQSVMVDTMTGQAKFTLVYYSQVYDGIPVFRRDLRLLVRNEPGYPLVLAANTLRDLGDFAIPAGALGRIAEGDAYVAALEFEPGLNENEFTPAELVIWAGVNGMKAEPTLALTFVGAGVNAAGEPQKWRFVADALSGELLYTESLICLVDVTGNVSGQATTGIKADFCNPEALTALPHARVTITGGSSGYADVNGNFTLTNPGSSTVTVTSPMQGLYFTVDNAAGSEENLSAQVTPPGPVNFTHNAANTDELIRAQVNGYVQANLVRDWVLLANATYPGISTDTNFPVYVNRTDGYCPGNAWYDGVSLSFCRASGSYPNTAWQSVVQHEYGHHAVEMGGSGQDQYGEGMSDVFSLLNADNPVLGYGFFGDCNSGLRNADNTMQYPCSGEAHDCAGLLSGCVWSTRNALVTSGYTPAQYLPLLRDLSVNSILLHNGSTIAPSITTDYLTLDDDDNDLSNGTPHSVEIIAGFSAHNMYAGPPPANDDCGGAIAVCPGTPVSGNTGSASNDGDANCTTSSTSPDLWYTYTPQTNGTLVASLCSGTSYDSVLSVHTGCPGTAANQVACDDDTCASGGPSQLSLGVTAGQTYHIRVSGWSGAAGPFTLTLTGPACGNIPLRITLPNGTPPAVQVGQTAPFDVVIENVEEAYQAGTGRLYYRYDGGSYQSVALTPLGGTLFRATLPAPTSCDDTPEFYISAQSTLGSTVTSPAGAPANRYTAAVGTLTVVLSDNFQTNLGWTAQVSGATSGNWQRGVPVNDASWEYDPAADGDGSGQCYLTQNTAGNTDVDGGSVLLLSPTLDLSGGGITISYYYFLRLTDTDGSDRLLVEISSNGGAGPWTEIARHNTDGGLSWRTHQITQAQLNNAGVTLTANMALRFTANDGGTASIVEAGLDGVVITSYECSGPAMYTLTVSTSGSGTVALDPPGGSYADGTIVSATADASTGWMFDQWTGAATGSTNPASVTMDANKSLTAIFVLDCNGNLVPDTTDISSGTSTDVNGSGVPDECESIGDANCSGGVDFADINAFVDVLLGAASPCNFANVDVNGDGTIDFGDINPFVTLLLH